MSLVDLTGKTFGRLTVLGGYHRKNNRSYWMCRCSCGVEKVVGAAHLVGRDTVSCGACYIKPQNQIRDITGKVFGRYTVIGPSERRNNATYWKCRCRCGTEKYVPASNLQQGNTVSCGCYQRERNIKHGMRHTKIYDIYCSMVQRCNNPGNKAYKNYGGRGIKIAPSWYKFERFHKDMGDRPPGRSLDRINNDGPYSRKNCRWATMEEQSRNRRDNIFLTYKGITRVLKDWAGIYGILPATLKRRLEAGIPKSMLFKKGRLL
jgi:hypothetical protein